MTDIYESPRIYHWSHSLSYENYDELAGILKMNPTSYSSQFATAIYIHHACVSVKGIYPTMNDEVYKKIKAHVSAINSWISSYKKIDEPTILSYIAALIHYNEIIESVDSFKKLICKQENSGTFRSTDDVLGPLTDFSRVSIITGYRILKYIDTCTKEPDFANINAIIKNAILKYRTDQTKFYEPVYQNELSKITAIVSNKNKDDKVYTCIDYLYSYPAMIYKFSYFYKGPLEEKLADFIAFANSRGESSRNNNKCKNNNPSFFASKKTNATIYQAENNIFGMEFSRLLLAIHKEMNPVAQQGGAKITERVIYKGRSRVVYVGPRGGRYVLVNGKRVRLPTTP